MYSVVFFGAQWKTQKLMRKLPLRKLGGGGWWGGSKRRRKEINAEQFKEKIRKNFQWKSHKYIQHTFSMLREKRKMNFHENDVIDNVTCALNMTLLTDPNYK